MLSPLPAQKWSYEAAAHLLNRAGFGGTPEEIAAAQTAGLAKTLDRLLSPPNESAADGDGRSWSEPQDLRSRLRERRALKDDPAARKAKFKEMLVEQRDETDELRLWWLERMRANMAPLAEKMTLFWHGHFATSVRKVRNAYWMWRQNETFRRYSLGNFRPLLKAVSRDPAMMLYLDLAQSKKEKPNENWAREVMELFTLGIGNYSEQDIREAARAFTGYRVDFTDQQFRYIPRQHDAGGKHFLGQEGNFSGDDILDRIVVQPACAEFIGRKLWRFFAEDEPSDDAIKAVAAALRRNDFELRPVLREMLSAEIFYAPKIQRNQIKSPVQFLVQSCKLLETPLPPAKVSAATLTQLGQAIFAPPNVKGWDGGKSWITTSTLLFRYNFAGYLVNGSQNKPNLPAELQRAPLEVKPLVPDELRAKPEELLAHLAQRLYQSSLGDKPRETFLAYLRSRAPDIGDETMRHLLHLMMSTPQFQLT